MQVIGIGRKVFCVAFVVFVFFLAGCHQKEYTPSEEDMATEIEKRLLNAKKGTLIVFDDENKNIVGLIIRNVNLNNVALEDVVYMIVSYRCYFNLPQDAEHFQTYLKYRLYKVIYLDDPEYEKYARKFILQQVGIYEDGD